MFDAVIVLQVDVVVSLAHERELSFPAVSICNMNPVKLSALNYSVELEALIDSSSSRRRRSAGQCACALALCLL